MRLDRGEGDPVSEAVSDALTVQELERIGEPRRRRMPAPRRVRGPLHRLDRRGARPAGGNSELLQAWNQGEIGGRACSTCRLTRSPRSRWAGLRRARRAPPTLCPVPCRADRPARDRRATAQCAHRADRAARGPLGRGVARPASEGAPAPAAAAATPDPTPPRAPASRGRPPATWSPAGDAGSAPERSSPRARAPPCSRRASPC